VKADEAARLDGEALGTRGRRAFSAARSTSSPSPSACSSGRADEAANAEKLVLAERFAAWAAHTEEGRWRYRGGVLFKPPQRVDPMHLVPVQTDTSAAIPSTRSTTSAARGVSPLTDRGTHLAGALDEAELLHLVPLSRAKDSCSKGLREKPGPDGAAPVQEKPLRRAARTAARWKERISEFHKLKSEGWPLGGARHDRDRQPRRCARPGIASATTA
jgi:hypothetical protein